MFRLPDAHRERAAKRLRGPELHLLARYERELRQVAQQLVVAVRDAFDRGLVAGLEAGEGAQPLAVEAKRRIGNRVAVRVVRRIADRRLICLLSPAEEVTSEKTEEGERRFLFGKPI